MNTLRIIGVAFASVSIFIQIRQIYIGDRPFLFFVLFLLILPGYIKWIKNLIDDK